MKEIILQFLADNWESLSTILLAILYEVTARWIPTEKNRSIIDNVVKLIGMIIKNRRKPSPQDDADVTEKVNRVIVDRDKHIISIFLLFALSLPAFAQQGWSNFKGIRLVNQLDSTQVLPVNGAIYYNEQSDKFRAYQNNAWVDLIGGSGGGGGGITNISPINAIPVTVDGSGNLGNQTNVQLFAYPDHLKQAVVNGTDSAYIHLYDIDPSIGARSIQIGVTNSTGVPLSNIRIGGGSVFMITNDGTTFSVVNASSGSASIYAFDATTQSQVQTYSNRILNKVQSGSIISEVNQTTTSYTFGIGDNSDTTHFSFTPDSVNITSSGNMSINADSIFFNNVPVDTSQYVLTQRFSDGRIGRKKISGGGPSFGTVDQIPYMNSGGTDFNYSSKLKWDNTNNRLIAGNGTISSGTNVINFGDNTTMTGSWSITAAEESTVRGNNNISAGWDVTVGDNINANSGNGTTTSGIDNLNYGIGSYVGGIGGQLSYVSTSQRGGFVHAFSSGSVDGKKPTGVEYLIANDGAFNVSRNTTSQTATHGSLAQDGAILGGIDHNIPSTSPRSAIIGGNAIKARASDPDNVYVPYLNVTEIDQNDALTRVMVHDQTTDEVMWRDAATLGGITNTAANNEIPKTIDGSGNLGSSGIASTTAGNLNLGLSSTTGTTRTIQSVGSGSDIALNINSKGSGFINLTTGGAIQNTSFDDFVVISDQDVFINAASNGGTGSLQLRHAGSNNNHVNVYSDEVEIRGSDGTSTGVISVGNTAGISIVGSGTGGDVFISTGNTSGATSANDIEISPGNASGSGSGGDIRIITGTSGSGIPGELFITISRTSCAGAPSGSVANVSGVLTVCP